MLVIIVFVISQKACSIEQTPNIRPVGEQLAFSRDSFPSSWAQNMACLKIYSGIAECF